MGSHRDPFGLDRRPRARVGPVGDEEGERPPLEPKGHTAGGGDVAARAPDTERRAEVGLVVIEGSGRGAFIDADRQQ